MKNGVLVALTGMVLSILGCHQIDSNKGNKFVADPASYVNTFIGTGGHGHTFPGATTPNDGTIKSRHPLRWLGFLWRLSLY
ncbi:hypothetical protein [Jejuia pallidilutea]|uniref:hypothetical protein n=1 Tax=Jejuia pallidilutea TaxID=504487 RepID=UPI001930D25F|nr:hypothetical protein [Jejuia pallidilutea]